MSTEILEVDPALQKVWPQVVQIEDEFEKINDTLVEETTALATKYENIKAPIYEKRSEILAQIPKFWSTAFGNHPMLSALLDEEDLLVFEYLTNLKVQRDEKDCTAYKIIMEFSENPYFENKELIKEFSHDDDGCCVKVKNHPITWKEGKDITKKSGQGEEVDSGSFFMWFTEDDAEIGELVANDLFPNALRYFQGIDEEEDSEDDLNEEDE
ncbi:hypothetical protein K7432_012107 [Basidiobolus ranarum]|uniref:Nucleosome assembly protein n=1 Tax=Basidiobolus ranarum TaxID=34480 RepID=A0ABR2VTB6_9FUNG